MKHAEDAMLFGCCAAIGDYPRLEALGYDCITLSAKELHDLSESDYARALNLIQGGKLLCNSTNDFSREDIRLIGPGYSRGVLKAYSERIMGRAKGLGIRYIGLGAPVSRYIQNGYPYARAYDELLESVSLLAGLAYSHGLTLLLEAMNSRACNLITTTDEALAFLERLGVQDVGLVYDTYHAYGMGESADPVARAMKAIKVVHTAHAVQGRRRLPAGDYMREHEGYFQALAAYGFHGEITLEAEMGEENELKEALATLKHLAAGLK